MNFEDAKEMNSKVKMQMTDLINFIQNKREDLKLLNNEDGRDFNNIQDLVVSMHHLIEKELHAMQLMDLLKDVRTRIK